MSDFRTILVRDSVIGDITSDIDFAVKSGASQTTYQRFPSTANSNSSVIFNVQVPSENVVIGRDILINTGLTLTITAGGAGHVPPIGTPVIDYGKTDSFACMPFNALLSTATCQINNTTVSINMQDVLPSLLRMNNSRELYRFNSTTASLPDQAYCVYFNGVGTTNNPLAGYGNASYDVDQIPRGSLPISIVSVVHTYTNSAVPPAQVTDDSLYAEGTDDTWTIVLSTIVTEPLFLSPWIFGEPEFNCQGLLGINNMAFTLNVNNGNRVWSSANDYITNIALGASGVSAFSVGGNGKVGNQVAPSVPSLLFKFLSTQPSDLIQTKNIVPYMDYPRYLTPAFNAATLSPNTTTALTSSNLQINQIPDLFIINIRKPMSQQTYSDANFFLTINNISINLNNQSGLLSSASAYDLWRMSVKNGSTQSWAEFSGQQSVATADGAGEVIPTTGSLLVINPAYDLSLPDYITSGSLGNYNFQFIVNVTNQSPQTFQPEIVTICVNSGIFTTQQGVSAVYTGILTKEMVLAAKSHQQADALHSAEVKRMTGGKHLNTPLTGMKAVLRAIRHRGHHSSGAGSSGGSGSSGGKQSRLAKML